MEYDYTGGSSGADLAGDNVNQMGRNRDWRRSFVLEFYCDKEVIYVIQWSYHVTYQSGWPDHATVVLDTSF